ncbi:MAG: Crp/Fnr family transcriptional regulator [Sphingobacterium composti]|uniref:Crp/Fnr family transcriptional regulator n=1 Tax=Sphingobacterium composti TaxID=363260 RepID=UPI00135B6961|nr:Crp/Fnr family transcriptional regulator [Sphingobacterium composti Ten et al. 2007 non Yoo et al. 2007]
MAKSELLDILHKYNLLSEVLHFERHAFIKTADSTDTYIYFIKSGSVKIGYYSTAGEELVRLGYDGDVILDLESFLTEQSSNLFIQTIKSTSLQRVKKSDFFAVIQGSPKNLDLYNRILEQLILEMLIREKDLLLLSPKERYERFSRRSPDALQHIPSKYIAQYLRMSPETLSRMLKS